MKISDLSTLNAMLNLASAILLMTGRIEIKRWRADRHKRIMLSAMFTSMLFLVSYSIYHAIVGSVPYSRYDWTRSLYFTILVPHVILAGAIVPFIILAIYYALSQRFDKHKRLVRIVWPVWMFVSLSGIAVYLMLYRL
jgi:putative membrane protein